MSVVEILMQAPLPMLPISPPYTFHSSLLFRQALTHKSCGLSYSSWVSAFHNDPVRIDNEHLEFLGDSVAKYLTAHLLDLLWPDLSEARLSDLTQLLINNRFYAYLSQRLGLADQVIAANSEARMSERVRAGVFEAYIGGMHRELGLAENGRLFRWFRGVIEGYAQHFYTQLGCGVLRKKKDGWEQKEEGKTWAAWLNEFTDKHGLQKPEYIYKANRRVISGSPVWECTVVLSGQKHGVAEGRGKKEAKEKACERTCSRLVARRAPKMEEPNNI